MTQIKKSLSFTVVKEGKQKRDKKKKKGSIVSFVLYKSVVTVLVGYEAQRGPSCPLLFSLPSWPFCITSPGPRDHGVMLERCGQRTVNSWS